MPTATGKLQLEDYDDALLVRGFDAFSQSTRYQLINLGYRFVARAMPFSWEETFQTYSATPGQVVIATALGLPNDISSIMRAYLTTDPYRGKLAPEIEERFVQRWLPLDFTKQQNWGIPSKYYYWEDNLYVLPPPQIATQFTVYFRQYLPDMIQPTDVSVMPQVMDEIVLDAALVRAHQRAQEVQLAAEAQQRVDAGIADLLQDDVWQMEELQERTLPDDQWW
jgi:hypothetical protein